MNRRHNMLRLHVKQQVCLDEFQALVNQRRGVNRHDRTHIPGRVCERLRRTHPTQLIASAPAERTARGCQHQISHLRTARNDRRGQTTLMHARGQRLGNRRVLRIDRHDLARETHRVLDQRAAHDQGFLIRQRQACPAVEGRERRGQTDATRNAIEDHRRLARIQLRRQFDRGTHDLNGGILTHKHLGARAAHRLDSSRQLLAHVPRHTHVCGFQGHDLRSQLGDRRAARTQTQHIETTPVRLNDLSRLSTNRTGRAQQNNGGRTHQGRLASLHQSTASRISIARAK